MAEQRLDFWKDDFVGAGPAQKKINITWIGNLRSAQLVVVFGGKFAWELKYAELNGTKFYPTTLNEIRTDSLKDALINGENTLVVVYDFNPITVATGDQTTLTAYIIIDPELVAFQFPSIAQWIQDFNTKIKDSTLPTIVILAIIAAIVIAVAFVIMKLRGGVI